MIVHHFGFMCSGQIEVSDKRIGIVTVPSTYEEIP